MGKKPRGVSKEDIEREAQREVERLTRRSGPPPGAYGGGGGLGGGGFPGGGGGGGGDRTLLDNVAGSIGGRSIRDRPRQAPTPMGFPGSVGAPPPSLDSGPGARDDDDEYDEDEEENIAVTEIALRDYAAKVGGRPEDHIVMPVDPASAEMMRDQAMRAFMEQQAARHRGPQPQQGQQSAKKGPSVLARLAERRALKDAGLYEEEDEEQEQEEEGSVLERIRSRRSMRMAPSEPSDEELEEEEEEEDLDSMPEFVQVARRMTGFARVPESARTARPGPGRRPPARGAGAKKSSAKKAPARKPPAKKAPARKAPARKPPARKAPAKKAPAKKAPAKKAPAKKAPAKKAPAKKAPAKKAPAKKAPAKRRGR